MKKYFIQMHLAILLAACSSIFGKLISLNAILIVWYRMSLAGIILLAIVLIKNKGITIKRSDMPSLYTGLLLALHWIFFYGSIKYANVSIGVICFCLSGLFTAITSPLINRQKVSITELLLGSMTLIGISLIFHFDSSFRFGISLGIISSILFALYATLNERINKSASIVKNTTMQMIGGSIGITALLPILWLSSSDMKLCPSVSDLGYLFLLALGCTVCMCSLLNNAQKRINAFTISLSFNLEPIYSIILAVIIFGENKMFGTMFYIGLSIIVLSILLQIILMVKKIKS